MAPKDRGCRSRHTSTDCHWNQDTPDQIHALIKCGRPKCIPAQRLPENSAYARLCREVISICFPSHQADEYGKRPFYRWVQAQCCSLDKNTLHFAFRWSLRVSSRVGIYWGEIVHYHVGAHGVVVIVLGNGHGDMSSNPGRDRLHFTSH